MYHAVVALHLTAVSLVVGTLFLQSLSVVMALRLKSDAQREGQRIVQRRIHWFIYYPILLVALATGLGLALSSGAFQQGRWLHWKLLGVVLLVGLGFLTGWEIRAKRVVKPIAMMVHIVIFLVSLGVMYLAAVRPY
jgi:protoporphyrinogen IX oxidase